MERAYESPCCVAAKSAVDILYSQLLRRANGHSHGIDMTTIIVSGTDIAVEGVSGPHQRFAACARKLTMQLIKNLLLAAGCGALLAVSAVASANPVLGAVQCGPNGGNRYMTINPALVGGVCYTQTGNLQNADYNGITPELDVVSEIEKDVVPLGDTSGLLQWTLAGATGTFSFSSALWSSYERIFIAFHWGNAGTDEPDSFAIELGPFQDGGDFSFLAVAGSGATITGLSNIYLLGVACPPNEPRCNEDDFDTPEPGTLLLLGVGALGLALRRRLLA